MAAKQGGTACTCLAIHLTDLQWLRLLGWEVEAGAVAAALLYLLVGNEAGALPSEVMHGIIMGQREPKWAGGGSKMRQGFLEALPARSDNSLSCSFCHALC